MVFGTSMDLLPEGGSNKPVAVCRIRSYSIPSAKDLSSGLRRSDNAQNREPGESHKRTTDHPLDPI